MRAIIWRTPDAARHWSTAKERGMDIETEKIRSYRLWAHHLDEKRPMARLLSAAGACGLQNSPPGAWETALWNRLDGCALPALRDALYEQKSLLQAWSYRGAPVVFPSAQSDIFLTALLSREGESPWIYTQGITGALHYLHMAFDDLLPRAKEAAAHLDSHTVKSKEALDRALADIIQTGLTPEQQILWRGPSMYGSPEKQTVGEAAVSFLLRPCSFSSLVVFGERLGASPTFTSFQNWMGRAPEQLPGAEKELVCKFLRCYGPATPDFFASWLGCSTQQAHRLWGAVSDELAPVRVMGKTRYILAADVDTLLHAGRGGETLRLLGAHDPYLDLRDKTTILEDESLHKAVWKYVANPGAVLKNGRVIGTWKTKASKGKLDAAISLWVPTRASEQKALQGLAEEYALFRRLRLNSCAVENL